MFRLESKGFDVPGRWREGTTARLRFDEAILYGRCAFSPPNLPQEALSNVCIAPCTLESDLVWDMPEMCYASRGVLDEGRAAMSSPQQADTLLRL